MTWRVPVRLADALTVARFVLAVPLTAVLWRSDPGRGRTALVLLIAGSLTDLLDGQVARASGSSTVLGAVLDPLADKALVDGALASLSHSGDIPTALAALVIGRDVLVTVLRASGRAPVSPSGAARLKTGLLYASLAAVLATMGRQRTSHRLALAVLWLAAGLSVSSALGYARPTIRR